MRVITQKRNKKAKQYEILYQHLLIIPLHANDMYAIIKARN